MAYFITSRKLLTLYHTKSSYTNYGLLAYVIPSVCGSMTICTIGDTTQNLLVSLPHYCQFNQVFPILGPLLFLIYINDIPLSLQSSLSFLFADNTKLMCVLINHNGNLLQSDLDNLSVWCSTWKLHVNSQKSACIRFSLPTITTTYSQYTLCQQQIPNVLSHCDLGLLIYSNLSWTKHITSMCQSAYQSLYQIKRYSSDSTNVHL